MESLPYLFDLQAPACIVGESEKYRKGEKESEIQFYSLGMDLLRASDGIMRPYLVWVLTVNETRKEIILVYKRNQYI